MTREGRRQVDEGRIETRVFLSPVMLRADRSNCAQISFVVTEGS